MWLGYISNDSWAQIVFVISLTVVIAIKMFLHFAAKSEKHLKPMRDEVEYLRKQSEDRLAEIYKLKGPSK